VITHDNRGLPRQRSSVRRLKCGLTKQDGQTSILQTAQFYQTSEMRTHQAGRSNQASCRQRSSARRLRCGLTKQDGQTSILQTAQFCQTSEMRVLALHEGGKATLAFPHGWKSCRPAPGGQRRLCP
ncbi:MAG: hypothetical protein RR224_07965, partial [Clostridia bacterium]